MRVLAAGVALLLATAGVAPAATDDQCLSDCAQRYTRPYCQQICSYGTSPKPTEPTFDFGLHPTDFGAAARESRESAARTELMEEQRRLIEQQRRAAELENDRRLRELASPSPSTAVSPLNVSADRAIRDKFLAAAAPRRQLYPDFDAVALRQDLPITVNMLWFMAQSPLAADIAYFLGQHPERAAEISRGSVKEQAAAINAIEANARLLAEAGQTFQ